MLVFFYAAKLRHMEACLEIYFCRKQEELDIILYSYAKKSTNRGSFSLRLTFIESEIRVRITIKIILASSGPYGPLLARSGYPGQNASLYNNAMVMLCAIVNALTLL